MKNKTAKPSIIYFLLVGILLALTGCAGSKVKTTSPDQVQQLQKENKRLKKLQKQFDKDQKLFDQDIKKTQKAMSQLHSGQGISKSQIPFGDEDLYILKSEIVPPVCPACPTLNCGNCKTKCPPCPPCARCPEPSFECKKVPNYKAGKNNPYLPVPWLNSFSQFNNQYT